MHQFHSDAAVSAHVQPNKAQQEGAEGQPLLDDHFTSSTSLLVLHIFVRLAVSNHSSHMHGFAFIHDIQTKNLQSLNDVSHAWLTSNL